MNISFFAGAPQNRKRAILLAAAPNCPLPHFPAMMHVFEQMPLNITVDDKQFDVNTKHWRNKSAPYRNMTALDGISDLPKLDIGPLQKSTKTTSDPKTWFQRMMKWNGKDFHSKITHHEAKLLSDIVMKRISYVPKELGADWRDIPNISVKLTNGNVCAKLKYPYVSGKTGKPAVCKCNSRGGKCGAMDRQDNTLIPFSLCHTGDR